MMYVESSLLQHVYLLLVVFFTSRTLLFLELRESELSRPRHSVLKTVAPATNGEFYIRRHGIRDILAIGGQFVPLLSRNRT